MRQSSYFFRLSAVIVLALSGAACAAPPAVLTPTSAATVIAPSTVPQVTIAPGIVIAGQQLTLNGAGWQPNEDVKLELRPSDIAGAAALIVGVIRADALGRFQLIAIMPSDMAPGAWTLYAAGAAPERTVTLAFGVVSPTLTTSPPSPTSAPTATPTSTPVPTRVPPRPQPTPTRARPRPQPTPTRTQPRPTRVPRPTAPPQPTATPFVVITDWRGEYFNNITMGGLPVVVRNDPTVDFSWGVGSPDPRINPDYFSARWTRAFFVPTGIYRLVVQVDDGVRVFVDGNLVLNAWQDGSREVTAVVALNAGDHWWHIEYYEHTGLAAIRFRFESVVFPTPTATPVLLPTFTSPPPTPVPTLTPWTPPTVTPVPLPTHAATHTPAPRVTPSVTPVPLPTYAATHTPTPRVTPSVTPVPLPTMAATQTATPKAPETPAPTTAATATATPFPPEPPTPEPLPTVMPIPTLTPLPPPKPTEPPPLPTLTPLPPPKPTEPLPTLTPVPLSTEVPPSPTPTESATAVPPKPPPPTEVPTPAVTPVPEPSIAPPIDVPTTTARPVATGVLSGTQLIVEGRNWRPGDMARISLSPNRRGTNATSLGEVEIAPDGTFVFVAELRRAPAPSTYLVVASPKARLILRLT